MDGNTNSGIFGFLAGLATGVILGVLYAPQSGEETRRLIVEKKDEAMESARKGVDNVKTTVSETTEKVRARIDSQVEDMRLLQQDLATRGQRIEELETRISQLETKKAPKTTAKSGKAK